MKLLGIEGLVLRVADIDMLDGTPVLDIKPYVAYADAFPNARAGWLDEEAREQLAEPSDPIATFDVHFTPDATAALDWLASRGEDLRGAIERALALGPAPHAYRRIRKKSDCSEIAVKDFRAEFTASGRTITVTRVFTGYSPRELATDAPAIHRAFVERVFEK